MTVPTESTSTRAPAAAAPLTLLPDTAAGGGKQDGKTAWLLGIAFTALIALIGWYAAGIPGLGKLGPLACSIALAVAYRQLWGYPEALRQGIQFCSKTLLRLAIILFGLKLDMSLVLHDGLGLLLRAAAVIAFAVVLTVWLGKRFKADPGITLLLAIGTGICGAAAIAAVSPLLQTKDGDTAIGAGMIALVGTVFAVGYTLLRPFLPVDDLQYGVWSGISLHEIAHVALAAAPAGPDALAAGLLAKLSRVLLLVPVCLLLVVWKNRGSKAGRTSNASPEPSHTKIAFPWFLLGFIATSTIGSYVIGDMVAIPAAILNGVASGTTFLLSMAMVGLGLNVNLKQLRSKALKPVLAMSVTSVLLAVLTYVSV